MFDLTKPVQTHCGYPARVVCTDIKMGKKITGVLALVTIPYTDVEQTFVYHHNGKVTAAEEFDRMDLVNF